MIDPLCIKKKFTKYLGIMTLPLQCQTKIKENKIKKCSSASTSYILVLTISKEGMQRLKILDMNHIQIKKL